MCDSVLLQFRVSGTRVFKALSVRRVLVCQSVVQSSRLMVQGSNHDFGFRALQCWNCQTRDETVKLVGFIKQLVAAPSMNARRRIYALPPWIYQLRKR